MTITTQGYLQALAGMILACCSILTGDLHPFYPNLGPEFTFLPHHLALWICSVWLLTQGLLRLLVSHKAFELDRRGPESIIEALGPKTTCDSDCINLF